MCEAQIRAPWTHAERTSTKLRTGKTQQHGDRIKVVLMVSSERVWQDVCRPREGGEVNAWMPIGQIYRTTLAKKKKKHERKKHIPVHYKLCRAGPAAFHRPHTGASQFLTQTLERVEHSRIDGKRGRESEYIHNVECVYECDVMFMIFIFFVCFLLIFQSQFSVAIFFSAAI